MSRKQRTTVGFSAGEVLRALYNYYPDRFPHSEGAAVVGGRVVRQPGDKEFILILEVEE